MNLGVFLSDLFLVNFCFVLVLGFENVDTEKLYLYHLAHSLALDILSVFWFWVLFVYYITLYVLV